MSHEVGAILLLLILCAVWGREVSIFIPTTADRLCTHLPTTIVCSINRQTVTPHRIVVGLKDNKKPEQRCILLVQNKSLAKVDFSIVQGQPTPGESRNQALLLMNASEAALFHDDDDCANPQAVEYATYLVNTHSQDVFIFNFLFGSWNVSLTSPFCPLNFSAIATSTNVSAAPDSPKLLLSQPDLRITNGYPLFAKRPLGMYNKQHSGEDRAYLKLQILSGRSFMYSTFPMLIYKGPKPQKQWSTNCKQTYKPIYIPRVYQLSPILWTLWFGPDIKKSSTHGPRERHLKRLESVDIVHRHITLDNLASVNVSTDPIHPQITLPYLSGIHKGDYMRSYLMYHHGGAYADIKANALLHWSPFFKDFAGSEAWVYGAREGNEGGVACMPEKLKILNLSMPCADVKRHYKKMLSNGAYIFKAHTPFARDWLRENNNRLDELSDSLQRHPSPEPGRCCLRQDPKGYPVRWTEFHGDIFHPLCVKYETKLQISKIGFHF